MITNSPSVIVSALQQPDWPEDQLRLVCEHLSGDVAPVDVSSCRALRADLARAASGDGFVVVGGDCAEFFRDASPARVIAKAGHLHRIADGITAAAGVATTRIGRFGGQFAKPRSREYEELADGRLVPSYRGDAVNALDPDLRHAEPARLLVAHRCTTDAVQALLTWDLGRRTAAARQRIKPPPLSYLGHEALLLDYERALLRHGGRHASSGHYLWIGDRTRHPDHAHVAFAASIDNPVGVKVGPSIDPAHVRALAEILDPEDEHRPGRLSFIVRMGAAKCATHLPPVIEALGHRAGDVLWILDPMHGNGRTNIHGQKTRLLADLQQEIRAFFAVLSDDGLWPGGIHLEMTPDDVTECVNDTSDLAAWLPVYRSACDPRLNPAQAASIAELVGGLLRALRPAGVPGSCRPLGAVSRAVSRTVSSTPSNAVSGVIPSSQPSTTSRS